jgi:phenylacetate-CoA ligase
MAFIWSEAVVETASRCQITDLQLKRLKNVVRRAYDNVPHYRRTIEAAGVHPDDLVSIEELARFPFTTKADLRDRYPYDMFAVPLDDIVRIHASSGTTGKPTVVGYTRHDIRTWARLVARSIRVAGGTRRDKMHIAYGYGLFTGGLGMHYGAEALGCAVVPVGGGMTERQVQLINDFRPDIISVTPSYLLAIADEFDRQGLDARSCSLRIALCGAEPWSEAMRSEIESRLGLAALDIYGLSELMGPGVGQEFAVTRDGPTIWEDHFLPEVIDPATGAVLPDGQLGELVLTSLTREAMPVIRYRTRDLTRLLPGTVSNMRRIERIRARSDDMLIIRGVNVFPTQIEEALMAEPLLAPNYLIEVDRPDRLDTVRVKVEARTPLTTEERDRVERWAEQTIKVWVGVTTTVEVMARGAIASSQGKVVRVIDRRRKE